MISIKYEPVLEGMRTAENVGNFATQQTLLANDLRQRQFNEEQARAQAAFAMQGVGQAFQQNLAIQDRDFRDQQAFLQDQRFNQQLAAVDRRNFDDNAINYERTRLMQDAANQRAAMGQQGQDFRQGQNLQARAGLQNDRQQFAQDLQGQRFGQQQYLQDDRQGFIADQNGQRFQNQLALQATGHQYALERQNDQQDYGTAQGNLRLQEGERNRAAAGQRVSTMANAAGQRTAASQAQQQAQEQRQIWEQQLQSARQEQQRALSLMSVYRETNPAQVQNAQAVFDSARVREQKLLESVPPLAEVLPPMSQEAPGQFIDNAMGMGPPVPNQTGYQPVSPQQQTAPPAMTVNGRVFRLVGYDQSGQPLYE